MQAFSAVRIRPTTHNPAAINNAPTTNKIIAATQEPSTQKRMKIISIKMANRAATTRKSRLQNTIAGPGGGGGVYGVGGATMDGGKGTRVGGEGGRIVR